MSLKSHEISSPEKSNSDSLLDNETAAKASFSKDSGRMSDYDRKFTQIFLEWEDLNYVVKKPIAGKVEEMTFLNKVSGFANPGEILAIMGPSGAGKTTLLNLLCNSVSYDENVKVEGRIAANGTNIKDFSYKDYIGYVTQQDILMTTMTSRESLTFAATLKIPASSDEIKELVNQMLDNLRLSHVADNIIGDHLDRGISGGECKRVSIGIELISEPSILFLDEPTSGLDSYNAEVLLSLLLDEAKKGRTIITTIHQPSASIFSKFHRLILIMEGNTVYQGCAKESRHYFERLGYKTQEYINPADYYMEVLNIRSRDNKTYEEKQRLNLFIQSYEGGKSKLQDAKSKLYIENKDLPALDSAPVIYKASWGLQFREIFKRSVRNSRRNMIILRMLFAFNIIEVLVVCNIVHFVPTDTQGVQTRTGVLFMLTVGQYLISGMSMSLSCNTHTVPIEKLVFFKEEASGFYSISAYSIARNIALLPQQIFPPLLASCISYWIIGFNPQIHKFLIYCIVYIGLLIILSNITGAGVGLCAGTILPRPLLAQPANGIYMALYMLFAGFFVSTDSILKPFDLIRYISPHKQSWQALMINEFTDADLDCEDCEGDVDCEPCDPLDTYSIDEDEIYLDIFTLIGMMVFYRALACYILYYYCKTGKGR